MNFTVPRHHLSPSLADFPPGVANLPQVPDELAVALAIGPDELAVALKMGRSLPDQQS